MRLSSTQWLNMLAIAGLGAMMIAAGAETRQAGADGVDPITTASVAARLDGRHADRFTAIDHRTQMSCQFVLHRASGYSVHRIEPDASCGRLGVPFERARAWREDRATVTVTDHRGETLMKLAPGDGFAWEVIEPSYLRVSLAAR